MQNLASEFSKIFRGGHTPGLSQREGGECAALIINKILIKVALNKVIAGVLYIVSPAPKTQQASGVGTQTLVPLNFSAVVATPGASRNLEEG